MQNFEIIFGNSGLATLQVNGKEYVHVYQDMEQLAQDVKLLLSGEDTSFWDGHEPEAYISDEDMEKAGRFNFRVIDQDDCLEDYSDSSWVNICEFSRFIRSA